MSYRTRSLRRYRTVEYFFRSTSDYTTRYSGGTPVRNTAARIATHAYAMPPATRSAVTRASPIPFGCRVLAGQVHSAEDHRAVVGSSPAELLSSELKACQSLTSRSSNTCKARNPHISSGPRFYALLLGMCLVRACAGPRRIGVGRTDFRACTGYMYTPWVIKCMYNVECVEARRLGV